ncbi:rare lipoprotein A [Sphingomonas laterariae]|uniref:Endolytic peptidoglycan transglycosylase RlpA n=1 Tax=Edaphosphingomonas laterariae TaxID=861865 RepID=A0A239BAR5_9SPHN|nr:SPOR domain-containing protein [Sphingomonas laterariae]SNS04682.1 rare lipoprotein A [Sphingomonas laterariae]
MKWRAELAVLAAATLLSACASTRQVSDGAVKIGKPYQVGGRTYVPRDDRDYDETGMASWYGGQHHGRLTANGERFDMDGLSAAHPTLPMPSYAEVTALKTGRTILVRINDRGPFAANRILDLSRGSARALGVEKEGVARVRVRRVYPSEAQRKALLRGREVRVASVAPSPARPATAPVVAPVGSQAAILDRYIQVAAFGDGDRADALAAGLRDVATASVSPGGDLYRVRLGPFVDEAATFSALAEVRRRGYQDAHIVSANP